MLKKPLDRKWHERDARSLAICVGLPDACYVYVQDADETVYILPDDRPHQHVRVLGEAKPALYAGDLTISNGTVKDLTNLSGSFQFDDSAGLLRVAGIIRSFGIAIDRGAVRLFSHVDGSRPRVLE